MPPETELREEHDFRVCQWVTQAAALKHFATYTGPTQSQQHIKPLHWNDIAIQKGGAPVETIFRFHTALCELTGRRGIRNDVSRYEAVSLAMIDMIGDRIGAVWSDFPPSDSPLRLEQFFSTLYLRYDERYVYSAPDITSLTRRLEWSPSSPVFNHGGRDTAGCPTLDYEPRLAASAAQNDSGT